MFIIDVIKRKLNLLVCMITANIDTTEEQSIVFNSNPDEGFLKKLSTNSLFLSRK